MEEREKSFRVAIFRSLCDFALHCLHSNSLFDYFKSTKNITESFSDYSVGSRASTTVLTLLNEREKIREEAIFHRPTARQGEECGVGISQTKKKGKIIS